MKTVEKRVRAGAALLDERRPGWRAEIDVESLDIFSGRRCILGQLYGLYLRGAAALGLNGNAADYGFYFTPPYTLNAWLDESERLTAAWKRFLSPSAK